MNHQEDLSQYLSTVKKPSPKPTYHEIRNQDPLTNLTPLISSKYPKISPGQGFPEQAI